MGIAALVILDSMRETMLSHEKPVNLYQSVRLQEDIAHNIVATLIKHGVPVDELIEDVCYVTLDCDAAIPLKDIQEHSGSASATASDENTQQVTEAEASSTPVSYTHLTLPTIYSV